VPTGEWVQGLAVGDYAPDPFGDQRRVAAITYRGVNVKGRAYVGVKLRFGPNATISSSYTVGEKVVTVRGGTSGRFQDNPAWQRPATGGPPRSERKAWQGVINGVTRIRRMQGYKTESEWLGPSLHDIEDLAIEMLRQLGRGIHRNPLLGVLGNPGGRRKLATRVYELRYRHAEGKHLAYRHPFRDGAEAWCLPDGSILVKHRRGLPLWKDFPGVRE
jgi:hypothetical protein